MIPTVLPAALILAGGAALLAALRPPSPTPPRRIRPNRGTQVAAAVTGSRLRGNARRTHRAKLTLAAAGAVGVWVLSGWVGALAAVPAAVFGLPALLGAPRGGVDLQVLSALEDWTRSLASMITGGHGLREGLIASLPSTPEAIRVPVTDLVTRLNARVPTARALDLFGNDLGDATGDMITAVLKMGSTLYGGGLASRLESLANNVAAEVTARRSIEAERAKPRTSARIVTLVMVTLVGYFVVAGRDQMAVYRTASGQLVLALLMGLFVLLLIVMRRMTTTPPTPRFLPPTTSRTGN